MVLTRSQTQPQNTHKYDTRLQYNKKEMTKKYLEMMENTDRTIKSRMSSTSPCPSPVAQILRRSKRIQILM
mgnify:CR=1 FL=1|tara:strand:- start:12599 stop:12811 length:213 start_codon:yes stop_codon:yes gene_type:complete